jgi:transketolase
MRAAFGRAFPNLAQELDQVLGGEFAAGWETALPTFPADAKGLATRVAAGKALAAVAPRLPGMLGGSADLNPSTHTLLQGLGDFESPEQPVRDPQGAAGGGFSYAGRNVHFGVRSPSIREAWVTWQAISSRPPAISACPWSG